MNSKDVRAKGDAEAVRPSRNDLARKGNKRTFDPHLFLATVADGRTLANYRKNEVVFSQGQPADAVFYIRKGKVKLAVMSRKRKQAVIAILGAGEFFGEECLNRQKLRRATASTLTESEVMRVQKAEMIRVLHTESMFAEMFMVHILARMSRVEDDLVDQLLNSSESRLARTLIRLADFGEDDTIQPIAVKISQGTLANIVGTTRSRVSFFMNKFRKLGFIDYNGDLKINNSLLTVVLRD